jgi:two-component system, cell cycle sensor histidine kinase and response regulator CckA
MIIKKSQSSSSPKLFNLIDELKDGFCTTDIKGNLIYLNIAAKELIQINGENPVNFYNDVVRDKKIIEYVNKYLETNEYLKDYEIELYTKNNNKLPCLISLTKILDPSDNYIGLSILIKDMTYIKQVQKQLLQAQKMESIGMLASGVAHEFNNILTAIIPNAELIKITTTEIDDNHIRADSIQKSANRASDIVKKLLNFARSDGASKTDSTNFIRVVNDTIEILRRLFDRKIELIFNCDPELLNTSVDDTSIQQIIMNLSINAKDAIQGSGIILFNAENITIGENGISALKNLSAGQYIKLEVSDTGHGIEKRQLEYIFDPFYTTKSPGKGTGLGLSMVYGIIKSFNGAISVESTIGKGTLFTIYLPATSKEPRKEISEFISHNIGQGRTVLVIDDEDIIGEMASDMLSSIGFKVKTAKNGFEGLNLYEKYEKSIDLVLLDLIMPGMDGATCFKKMLEINPEVKVIVSSGMGEQERKNQLLKMGIVGYLEKPYSMKGIAKIIEEIL